MSEVFIENRAVEFIKNEMEKENADAVRIFIAGGGCCPRLEIAAVNGPLMGDVTFDMSGIILHLEKYLADNTSSIELRFDEERGLVIDLIE